MYEKTKSIGKGSIQTSFRRRADLKREGIGLDSDAHRTLTDMVTM